MKHPIWIAIALVAAALPSAPCAAKTNDCPPANAQWTDANVAQCIADLTKRIDQRPAQSTDRVELLSQRAHLHEFLQRQRSATGDKGAKTSFEAALADYSEALAIAPRNDELRRKRAQLLIEMGRGEDALKDAETLLAQEQASVRDQALKGDALAATKRHKEAIAVYTRAIALAQSCAEASQIQEQVNKYRHAFDPPPTKEQALEEMRNMRNRPIHDVPETAVKQVGFPCAPSPPNTFDELVMWKSNLFERRGDSHHALDDRWSAIRTTNTRY